MIESYLKSNLSQRAFAAQAGLSVSALQYWLRKSRGSQKQPATQLVELPFAPLASRASGYRLHFAKECFLEIPAGFRAEEVRQLWQVLQQP